MHVVIIGGGSVGLLLAARLRAGGAAVELVTRSQEQADQLRRHGLTLRRLDGERETVTVAARSINAPVPAADVYLLAVKQTDVVPLLPYLRQLPPTARLIALQNGLGHHEKLSDALPPDRCFFAINTEGARRTSAGEVEHTGSGLLRIGPWDKQDGRDPVIASLVETAIQCGIQAVYEAEIRSFAWRKLLANALINPLTALFEIPNGMLLDSPQTLQLMRELFDEAAAVAHRCGLKIDEADWQEIVTICRNTSRNLSSMLQDVQKRKPTEIEAINGYLVQKGRELGIATPRHETIRRAILLKTSMGVLKGEARDGRFG
jgi:2-dehydropantoate 2-reductase